MRWHYRERVGGREGEERERERERDSALNRKTEKDMYKRGGMEREKGRDRKRR